MAGAESFFDGFMDDYFAECDEHLGAASRELLVLEQSIGTPEPEQRAIGELFRFFHSLKGISAMVELRPAEQLSHSLEEYLRSVRAREVSLTQPGVDLLIEGTQRLEQIITAHRFKRPQPPIDDVVARLEALVHERGHAGVDRGVPLAAAHAPFAPRRWRGTFTPTRELLARGIGVDGVRKQLAAIGRIVDAAPQVRPDGTIMFQFAIDAAADSQAFDALRADGVEVTEVIDGPEQGAVAQSPALAPAAAVAPSHVVRVDLTRLDELMQGVGDLVISRARLADTLARMERYVPPVEWRGVQENATAIDRQLRALREGIMRIRLVPIGEIFRRMPFVVRDLARENGRKIALELQGQSTEIDKYLIERMMDPVLHLVRNAVSHGIEAPADRIAAGKRPEGVVTLSASAAGEIVTIEISDDGGGIDAAAVAARARAAGLAVPPGTPDSAALLALLCSPGFSTRDEADRASGRGVGMAVVKSTVEQLSGTISLVTEAGAGTRFTIELPLTLAIADALIGRVGTEAFAVPQQAVREVIEVASADVHAVEQNELIPYRDGALPIVRLSRLFGIQETAGDRFHVFVIGTGNAAVGLAVDRIVGQREIVVRGIADPLVRVDGISGATDLGDGRVVLILDPSALARLTRQRAARALGRAGDWGRVRA
ncbi:MAG TPA: chemotaxis protein CheA [Vicinamibacterales bacterium]|nr:chemotaxis protein CheA [Vicinamibacterales bacterium]